MVRSLLLMSGRLKFPPIKSTLFLTLILFMAYVVNKCRLKMSDWHDIIILFNNRSCQFYCQII